MSRDRGGRRNYDLLKFKQFSFRGKGVKLSVSGRESTKLKYVKKEAENVS